MKRLFKSKPGIDPLPPPPPSPPPTNHYSSPPPPPLQPSQQPSLATAPPQSNHAPKRSIGNPFLPDRDGHHMINHGFLDSRPKHGVTPFPVDLGTNRPTGKGKDRSMPNSHTAPSLLEIQQMQAHAQEQERDSRRDQWLASQRISPQEEGSWVGSPPQGLYLPPGARPPSPQQHTLPRSSTPTRPYAPSQSSYSTSHGQHGVEPMEQFQSPNTRNRDRGYSAGSNSQRSDHEHANYPAPPPVMRSPLANNAYSSPEMTDAPFPQAHPFSPPFAQAPLEEQIASIRIEAPTPDEVHGKEKKKFWGMSNLWERERKDRSRPMTPDEGSRFVENFQDAPSSHGHDEHRSRGMLFGRVGGGGDKDTTISTADNVTTAIQMLCSHPDPPFSTSFEICERINHSTQTDSVSKEAAHALRKQFKHGNEAERRAATHLWLIMMQNTNKAFQTYASSKKFLVPLDTILMSPPNKPLVSLSTRKVMTDVIADLTYNYGQNSEALVELWKKVKMPQDADFGIPLPADHQAFAPDTFYEPTRPPDANSVPPPVPIRQPHNRGPGYAALPDHGEDLRRLLEECTAARESARVLAEALVFTRPDELEHKPLIHEFYRKCFLAHESLTGQIGWAQAEAGQSRERVLIHARMDGSDDQARGSTIEEDALSSLLDAHNALGDALKQHDDLERMARDEREMREVRERSKKDTRMQRTSMMDDMLKPGTTASSSRSPSPAPHARLPAPDHAMPTASPRRGPSPLPAPIPAARSLENRSRTPSPDRLPRITNSPGRASPLGMGKSRRPLPNPFARDGLSSVPNSQQGHSSLQGHSSNPSRSGTGSTHDDGQDDSEAPSQPSRKALGKRRAQAADPDSTFDPNDMFGLSTTKKSASSASSESLLADEAYIKPVTYAYDAYQEKLEAEAMSRKGSSTDHAMTQQHSANGAVSAVSPHIRQRQGSVASVQSSTRSAHRRMGSGDVLVSPARMG
ncbi:hypothetical protein BD324DRAFT_639653 [Kockovaella imperatae]|uniref:VHS domain-containing protein n=1 Tax=Kockovaella imperatae TaxID=4999 RepID=A0A1Y1U695_9TREE|nr:hypothetical protein BD324DRAFT_639653 [Kockovaella imperatae]ORX33522.1 hypothetical protein BD324DRAFT_639653 [Kockovaella imperatae]